MNYDNPNYWNMAFGNGMAIDEYGNEVSRTKATHPYNYDSFVQERVHPNGKATGTVYTDRLLQDNYTLTRELIKKHFGGGGDNWGNRSAAQIQGFLRERLEAPDLEVVLVMECCNQSSGFPLWRINYFNPCDRHVTNGDDPKTSNP